MAGLWFSTENSEGKLKSSFILNNADEGFSNSSGAIYGRQLHFYALMQLDDTVLSNSMPLLTIYGGPNETTIQRRTDIVLNQGIIEFKHYYTWGGEFLKIDYVAQTPLPTGKLIELSIGLSSSLNVWVNGDSIGVTKNTHISNQTQIFSNGAKLILGGTEQFEGQAAGVWIRSAIITNQHSGANVPQPTSSSSNITVWNVDFEDSSNPLKIITSRNKVSSELQWTNTDEATVVWSDSDSPPSSSGSSGGIIIPGNGKTTRIQGTVMEDDQPVARRVFAITQALLEIDGSQATQHAVLNSVLSDSSNGSYSLDTSPYEGAVFVMAVDDYGQVWQASTTYEVGHVIRPANFQGYVYHCTVAGTGDSTEPTWWFDDSVKAIGTAQFKAKPYTRPLAHGPVIPEIVPES
ncbi:hypothetical protein [Endozoicomonas sp. 4G]|uniref:hypothetical protein n=1 Tax=Endozoicomonas sp. 4G TaxID=2872754 RepID=UPI002078CFEB|nr:hypothetical protein [Endozoicomonas sp. 4G]